MVVVNGVDVGKVRDALRVVGEQASVAENRVRMNLRRARAIWPGGGLSVRVFCGRASFRVDEPVEPGAGGEAPTAVEYLLGSLAACVAVGVVYNASLRNISLDSLEVAAEGRINNILTFLGLESSGHPGFEEVSLKVYVRSSAREEELRELVEHSIATSPVVNSLTRSVQVKHELKVF